MDPPSCSVEVVEEFIDEAMCCDQINLYEVKQKEMEEQLHKNIGALTSKAKNCPDLVKGSGALISENLVLTAAHNLYHCGNREFYSDFRFYPKQHGDLDKYVEVQDFFIPGSYILNPVVANDYALLKLKEKVKSDSFIPLSANTPDIKNHQKLSIYGYPGSKYNSATKSTVSGQVIVNQFGSSRAGRLLEKNKEKGKIVHQISTLPGVSGAPIILEVDKHLTIVGIHKAGVRSEKNGIANVGRMITDELIDILTVQAKRMKGQMFEIEQKKHALKYLGDYFVALQNKERAKAKQSLKDALEEDIFHRQSFLYFLEMLSDVEQQEQIQKQEYELLKQLKQKDGTDDYEKQTKQALQFYLKDKCRNVKDEKYCYQIESFEQQLNKIEIDKKSIRLLELIGSLYYTSKDYSKAYNCCFKVLDSNSSRQESFDRIVRIIKRWGVQGVQHKVQEFRKYLLSSKQKYTKEQMEYFENNVQDKAE